MLVRRIFGLKEWIRLSEGDPKDANPSYQMIKEFFDNELSVYKVDSAEEVLKLAAALCMIRSEGPTRCILAAINDKVPQAMGWKFKKSPGVTAIKVFDENHFDIIVQDLDTLGGVFRSFLEVEPFEFSQQEISGAITQLFREGCYNVLQVAASAKQVDYPPARGMLKAISSSLIGIHAA